jgi:hypothetical protein
MESAEACFENCPGSDEADEIAASIPSERTTLNSNPVELSFNMYSPFKSQEFFFIPEESFSES